mmetsp:Transcript_7390/g.26791  ORF Transcript_7390/g.26791 Transcript_7390/m.26791 type:complete len:133 (-) Transcript_7390:121-519(-)
MADLTTGRAPSKVASRPPSSETSPAASSAYVEGLCTLDCLDRYLGFLACLFLCLGAGLAMGGGSIAGRSSSGIDITTPTLRLPRLVLRLLSPPEKRFFGHLRDEHNKCGYRDEEEKEVGEGDRVDEDGLLIG